MIDYVSALVEFAGGARGTFTATQAAAGGANDIRLRIYGEKGLLEWNHREPSFLSWRCRASLCAYRARRPVPAAGNHRARRTPRGHPEGLREAFANIYAEVAQERMARSLGEPVPAFPYPRIEEAAHTMAFIEACIASQASGRWESVAKL